MDGWTVSFWLWKRSEPWWNRHRVTCRRSEWTKMYLVKGISTNLKRDCKVFSTVVVSPTRLMWVLISRSQVCNSGRKLDLVCFRKYKRTLCSKVLQILACTPLPHPPKNSRICRKNCTHEGTLKKKKDQPVFWQLRVLLFFAYGLFRVICDWSFGWWDTRKWRKIKLLSWWLSGAFTH